MAWLYLILAGLGEVVWAIALKQSASFTRFWPSVITVVALLASFYLLTLAFRHIPTGVAYAIWTGIGAVGVALVSFVWMGETLTLMRWASIGLIVLGMIGLKMGGP